ncbi:hypothetical protein P170DRAFT_414102 [Aspergillus steynii IBT 23096]|uniref:rRNA-processing protein EFG1 n=1 Tax=Aspergillus steynii IBT 23096 TaxID=1392250 RepID=A0A2I2FYG6_9EURO|nr:uncharacterized protein P170DRAFT_414102 [Aspergillus steynii IBT 23096]PLB45675.1 hypothetical protein P170DRAFT_414102 [Aspergillus steynii IBT 23096]
MPRDYSRSASPVAHPTKDRKYRDRSDARPKRKDRDGSDDAAPARKKIQMPRKETNYPSVNELKKRIRDVKRLLNKVDLPADARIVQERALAGYEKDLEDENSRRDRSKMIKKYHFVRFLDRKTATKDVNRLLRREKALAESDDASSKKSKLAQKIHVARVNLNYTIYYPLTEKYIALYAKVKKDKERDPKDDTNDSDDDAGFKAIHTSVADKPALWHTVEKCMKDGTLDLLRDGKLSSRDEGSIGNKSSARQSEKKTAKSSKKTDSKKDKTTNTKSSSRGAAKKNERAPAEKKAVVNENNDDDESDGGFFEM